MSASALPGKTKTSDICVKVNKNFNKFYIFGPVAPNSQSIALSNCRAALCQPDDFQECGIQKVTGEVWIGLKQNIIDTADNETRNHFCACGHVKSWHFKHFLL